MCVCVWGRQQNTWGCGERLIPPTTLFTTEPRLWEADEQEPWSWGDAVSVLTPDPTKKQGTVHIIRAATMQGKQFPWPQAAGGAGNWGPSTSCQGKKELRGVSHLPAQGRGAGRAPRGRDEFKAAGKSWGAVVTALLHLDPVL